MRPRMILAAGIVSALAAGGGDGRAEVPATQATRPAPAAQADLPLVPWPASVGIRDGAMPLTNAAQVVAASADLVPLGGVLAEEIRAVCGLNLKTAQGAGRPGDVILRTSGKLKGEACVVRITDVAVVEGGSYAAVAAGSTTLLQLLRPSGGGAAFPRIEIADEPGSAYRGLLIDVARKYHSIDTLRQCIRLCRLYKVRYLQLHLTDDPAFTFPSAAFPLLTTMNHHGGPAYTLEELRDLERFASDRGVVIVPELEVPGHAGAMNRTMPDLFKIKGTKPYEHHASINFANDEVLKAVDTLVGEICEVFRSSPYFHIGGDEADVAFAHQHGDFQAAFRKYGLGEKGQWQLYRNFLIQMDQIVRKRGKQMVVWESFQRDERSQFQIPKDVLVMEYECPFYPPRDLVADGYTVINACWTPLYVVNAKRWSPQQIYQWDLWLFGQHSTQYGKTRWHRLEPTRQIIGAQMCAWEQPEAVEISSLRCRLPAMAERAWSPAARRSYADFARRAAATDALLSRLVPTVRFQAEGLLPADSDRPDVPRFRPTMKLAMRWELPAAEIRYTLDGSRPAATGLAADAVTGKRPGRCLTYAGPISLDKTTLVRAAAFDSAGRPVGHPGGEMFYLE